MQVHDINRIASQGNVPGTIPKFYMSRHWPCDQKLLVDIKPVKFCIRPRDQVQELCLDSGDDNIESLHYTQYRGKT